MKKLFLTAALCLVGMAAMAQQNLNWGQGPQVVSPDVHADNSVTFNLIAPEAQKVQITGDMLPPNKVEYQGNTYDMPGVVDLVKDDKGVWSYTTPPLQPELYTYNMIVDGVKIIDPLNVYNIRDINNLFSVLLIGGDARTDLYKVNKVPHGTVSKVWYESPTANLTRRLTVYTPAGYETSGKEYPVLYLLHGECLERTRSCRTDSGQPHRAGQGRADAGGHDQRQYFAGGLPRRDQRGIPRADDDATKDDGGKFRDGIPRRGKVHREDLPRQEGQGPPRHCRSVDGWFPQPLHLHQ